MARSVTGIGPPGQGGDARWGVDAQEVRTSGTVTRPQIDSWNASDLHGGELAAEEINGEPPDATAKIGVLASWSPDREE